MDLPKYRELSDAGKQKLLDAGVLNGCGPESWRSNGPNWFFKANCMEHDYNYAVGNTEEDRRWADAGFYRAMLGDICRLPWYFRAWARFQAWRFYMVVRYFGKPYFNYGDQPKDIDEMIQNVG